MGTRQHHHMTTAAAAARLVLAIAACMWSMVASKSITDPGQGYDPSLAKHFASLASTTYCEDTSRILDWTCQACAESSTPLVPGKIKIIDAGKKNATRVIVGKLKNQHGCLM